MNKTTFSKYFKVLQAIGNTRLPYMVFVEDKAMQTEPVRDLLSMPCTKRQLICKDKDTDTVIKEVLAAATDKAKPAQMLVLVDANLRQELIQVFDELQLSCATYMASQEVQAGFKLIRTCNTHDCFVYKRNILPLGKIRAYKSEHAVVNGVKAETYHTLFNVIGTDIVLLAIWDIREIVAVGTMPANELAKHSHVNDNSRQFCIKQDLFAKLSQEQRKQLEPHICILID